MSWENLRKFNQLLPDLNHLYREKGSKMHDGTQTSTNNSLETGLEQESYTSSKYWKDQEYRKTVDKEAKEELIKYLSFLSTENLERNVELLKSANGRNWSHTVQESEYNINSKYLAVEAHRLMGRGILLDKETWDPIAEDMLEAYEYHKKNYQRKNPYNGLETATEELPKFKDLLDASKSSTALEIYNNLDENKSLTGEEIKEELNHSWSAYYQGTLPNMDDVDIIDWSEHSIDGIVEPGYNYFAAEEFIASAREIVKHHTE